MHIHSDTDEEKIRKTLQSFVGKIMQLPPIKSSVKRQVREREIYYIKILEIKKQDVLFRIGCQAGTYIRKICHDIGKKLGPGAHMAELVRTKAGPFKTETLVTLQDLEDAYWYYKNENNERFIRHCIQPIENAVEHLAKVWVFDSTVDALCHGAKLAVPGISKIEDQIENGDAVAIMSLKDELIAVGEAKMSSKDMMEKEKGIAVDTHKVFMLPSVYPKVKKE